MTPPDPFALLPTCLDLGPAADTRLSQARWPGEPGAWATMRGGDSILLHAIQSRLMHSLIEPILVAGVDPNTRTVEGHTALMCWVNQVWLPPVEQCSLWTQHPQLPVFLDYFKEPLRITQAFLDAGADVNAVSPFGDTVLMFAARSNPAALGILLQAGADPAFTRSPVNQTAEQQANLTGGGISSWRAEIYAQAYRYAEHHLLTTQVPAAQAPESPRVRL